MSSSFTEAMLTSTYLACSPGNAAGSKISAKFMYAKVWEAETDRPPYIFIPIAIKARIAWKFASE